MTSSSVNGTNVNSNKPNKKKQVIVSPTESHSTVDTANRLLAFGRSLSDPLAFSDAAVRAAVLIRTSADLFSIAENPQRLINLALGLTDTSSTADSVTGAHNSSSTTAADSFAFSDSSSRLLALDPVISDTFSMTDSAAAAATFARAVTDSASFSESSTRALAKLVAASDSQPTSDAASASRLFERTAADSLSESDVADTSPVITPPQPTDSFAESDYAEAGNYVGVRSVQDVLTASDSALAIKSREETVLDSLAAQDSASSGVVLVRSVADYFVESDTTASPSLRGLRGTGAALQSAVGVGAALASVSGSGSTAASGGVTGSGAAVNAAVGVGAAVPAVSGEGELL